MPYWWPGGGDHTTTKTQSSPQSQSQPDSLIPLPSPGPFSRPCFFAHRVSVFHPSPDPSPVSLSLLISPDTRWSSSPHSAPMQICSPSILWKMVSRGYCPCTGNCAQPGAPNMPRTDSLLGYIASTIQLISVRHVQTAVFEGQIWSRLMNRHTVHS